MPLRATPNKLIHLEGQPHPSNEQRPNWKIINGQILRQNDLSSFSNYARKAHFPNPNPQKVLRSNQRAKKSRRWFSSLHKFSCLLIFPPSVRKHAWVVIIIIIIGANFSNLLSCDIRVRGVFFSFPCGHVGFSFHFLCLVRCVVRVVFWGIQFLKKGEWFLELCNNVCFTAYTIIASNNAISTIKIWSILFFYSY